MEPIRIKIHSFVDLITNSSTEIYISCHKKSVEAAKGLIDSLLQAAGSEKKADDLFEFKVMREAYDEETGDELQKELVTEGDFEEIKGYHDYYNKDTLIVTPKDKTREALDMVARLKSIFCVDAEYNG
jgi:hypothetical protein